MAAAAAAAAAASSLTTPKLTFPSLQSLYRKLPLSFPLSLSSSSFLPLPKTLTTTTSLSSRRPLSHHRRRHLTTRAEAENGAEASRHYDFDLFTIGAGSGGVRASRFAANFGASVAVCELPFSTVSSELTCVLRGCVPKKLLVYASKYAHEFDESRGFGWKYDSDPLHDWDTLMANKNAELQRLTEKVLRDLMKRSEILLQNRCLYEELSCIQRNHLRLLLSQLMFIVTEDQQRNSEGFSHVMFATGRRLIQRTWDWRVWGKNDNNGAIEATKEYGDIDVFTANFRPLKATLSGLPDRVFMKLIVCAKTNKVLGLNMCGEDSPEIVQGFAVAIKAGLTKEDFDSTVGIHPTAAEEFVTMRTPTRKIREHPPAEGKTDHDVKAAAGV
uniref:Pyridine nucleotide-disulphide oxidoreductase dimerisation domain-containing protein n=1 Tax=Salix viminalis TaxID=40686 RepID=A0A6N2KTJ0_SALVM